MKLPFFKFFPGDWVQDTRSLSLSAKGAWIDLLAAMWHSQNRGMLTLPLVGYSRLIGASVEQTEQVIKELTDMRVCECENCNGVVTLSCRRILKEEKQRSLTYSRVQKHREMQDDDVVTPDDTALKRICNAFVTPQISEVRSQKSEKEKIQKENSFQRPSAAEVEEYARSISFDIDGEHFLAYYDRIGWKWKGSPIKSWKACVVTWKKNHSNGLREKPKAKGFVP